ncbi:unnamed protein product [Amoebophrya sp. A120]|nr:unnamed protein product [Amoebophrya sp. A120]|eukprot:GSA120T00020411001.1
MSSTPGCDFVLFGASGFIGQHILEALEKQNLKVVTNPKSLRLENAEGVLNFIKQSQPIRYGVINSAGVRGQPNIDWCLDHPCETIEANILGQLNVARACRVLGEEVVEGENIKAENATNQNPIHCTFVGSCMVYPPMEPEDARIVNQDYYDEEKDTIKGADYIDNIDCKDGSTMPTVHFYRKARCVLEDLLSYYPNVLNLRVQFPISMKDRTFENKQSLLGKLRNFTRVDKAMNSITFLENLCPTIPQLVKTKTCGNLNFVNPGAVDYEKDLVQRLKTKLENYNPEIRDNTTSTAANQQKGSRGSILLSTEKLMRTAHSPDFPVLSSRECLDLIFGE